MKSRRQGAHSLAKWASTSWECGYMNALVGHQLLPWIAQGFFFNIIIFYFIFLSFSLFVCLLNMETLYVMWLAMFIV